MKKYSFIILFFLIFLSYFNVYGLDKKNLTLVSNKSVSSFNTDTFNYKDISFSVSDDRGTFNFQSITNNTESKMPVSINILLFDNDKKNIGFVTYCSEKDYSSEYAQFMLKGQESTTFNINVAKRYFIEGKSLSDFSYYAVLDDNKYCQIGGYEKYKGLTFDEIVAGKVFANNNKSDYQKLREMFDNYNLSIDKGILLTVIIIVISFFIRGLILNALYKRMYSMTSILSYLPIGTSYVSFKLSFGSTIAGLYLLIYLISIPLSLIGIGAIVLGILSICEFISFVIVIIKLITKNYNMFINTKSNIQQEVDNSNRVEESLLDEELKDNNSANLQYSDNESTEVVINKEKNDDNEEGSDLTRMFK